MEGKYIIVRSNRLNNFSNKINSEQIRVINMFRKTNIIGTALKEFFLKFHRKLPNYLFNPELKMVDADTIIVFDGHVRLCFLEWLRKKNPNKRIILWLWNTVEEIEHNLSLDQIQDEIEIWSYSPNDCKRYGYKYNTTFYWNVCSKIPESCKLQRDIFFVGKDKGRLKKIKEVEVICNQLHLSYLFHVVATHRWERGKENSVPMIYEEVMRNIYESKALLDIRASNTAGPSLRALEAAFYNKKLVTDDFNVESFRFYSPSNIFILGKDDINKLRNFINKNFVAVNPVDIEWYSAENWVKRFG